jgi:hypothetical protein
MLSHTSLVKVACLLVIGLSVGTSALVSSASASGATQSQVLKAAGPFMTAFSYSLTSLPTCEVGDGSIVLVSDAHKPIRILAVRVRTPLALRTHDTVQLVTFRPGSTTGEIAPSFQLTGLSNGRVLGDAVGQVLEPTSMSHRWYGFIVRVHLTSNALSEWEIRGLDITYLLRDKTHHVYFAQSIRLPRTSGCK